MKSVWTKLAIVAFMMILLFSKVPLLLALALIGASMAVCQLKSVCCGWWERIKTSISRWWPTPKKVPAIQDEPEQVSFWDSWLSRIKAKINRESASDEPAAPISKQQEENSWWRNIMQRFRNNSELPSQLPSPPQFMPPVDPQTYQW